MEKISDYITEMKYIPSTQFNANSKCVESSLVKSQLVKTENTPNSLLV